MPTNLSFGTHAKCFWVVIDVWTLPPYRYCVERRRRRHFNTTNVYIFGPSSQLNSNMNLSYLLLLFIIILGDPASLVTANKCFADRDELKTAIDGYMINVEGCRSSKNECAVGQIYGWPMNNWCVGNVTDMGRLFFNMQEFNEDISDWDVSGVTYTRQMFKHCRDFNSDISKWNVSKVERMDSMFENCRDFNSDISKWE